MRARPRTGRAGAPPPPPRPASRSLDDGAGAPAERRRDPGGAASARWRVDSAEAPGRRRRGSVVPPRPSGARRAAGAEGGRVQGGAPAPGEGAGAPLGAVPGEGVRASVADHHAELTHQLREGWLAARKAKQEELERDYGAAVAGVGRAQRDAARRTSRTARGRTGRTERRTRWTRSCALWSASRPPWAAECRRPPRRARPRPTSPPRSAA